MIRILLAALAVVLGLAAPAAAQDLQSVLQRHQEAVANPSRGTVGQVLADLLDSELPEVPEFLDRWQNRAVSVRAADGLFFYTRPGDGDALTLLDISTGEPVGSAPRADLAEIRPNGGVRREIATALVAFQLSDPNPAGRRAALDAIARSPSADQIAPLRASIEDEEDPVLRARKERLAGILAARFAETTAERIAAIDGFAGEIAVDVRGALNLILTASPESGPPCPTARTSSACSSPEAPICRSPKPTGGSWTRASCLRRCRGTASRRC
jgi:urea transport system permease protein